MHSVQFLPNFEWEQSKIVEIWDPSISTVGDGTYRCFLFSTGTQNNGSSSWPIIHPSPYALHHRLISISVVLVLSCKICYFPGSYTRVEVIVCQCCSISFVCMWIVRLEPWTQKWSGMHHEWTMSGLIMRVGGTGQPTSDMLQRNELETHTLHDESHFQDQKTLHMLFPQ